MLTRAIGVVVILMSAPALGCLFRPLAAQSRAVVSTEADSARIRRDVEFLAREARVAGTPAQAESADYVLRELATAGWDTARVEYRVYLPFPESTYVDRLKPQFGRLPLRLLLKEISVAGDSLTEAGVWPAMAAYSGGGDARGPLVFANLGRPDDYRTLAALGIDVRGKVALVRQGGTVGAAAVAESRGAVALLLYADPADDGYVMGDPYPVGAMRPPDGVRRLSLLASPGDPSTPGWASTPAVHRLPRDSMPLPRIPVVPISYRNVMHLLPALGGASVPQAWQGGLPMRYHVGGDTSTIVRVAVWPETGARAYKTIINTIATLRGADLPSEIILAGAHRDAWGRGAADNASGVATLLEAARVLGARARAGHRPARTIVVATWDAGEWGHIGVTEYAEQAGAQGGNGVVAYLNHDVTVDGSTFSATADPALAPAVLDAAAEIPAPGRAESLLAEWRRSGGGTPGPIAGSQFCGDCEPIRGALRVPAVEFGFRAPEGVLHSAYDGPRFSALVDPSFRAHVAAARLSAALLSRLANASALPLARTDHK